MSDLLHRLKPAVSRRVQLLLAAGTWTVVGLTLVILGARWCLQEQTNLLPILLVAAVAVGLAKAVFVLRHAADRVVRRIQGRGDDRCVGGFFSWRTWILVAVMIIGGRLLRGAGMSPALVGAIYVAIGVALLLASWRAWRAWYG
ncbi:MAG: hypothetical protein ACYS0G_03570 [Planctomycetota bacterium]|jgi:hypothetical protein